MIQILLVDDHPIVREGLASLLSNQSDFKICGEADDVSSALGLVTKTKPHVVIVDISLKRSSGLDLISQIAEYDRSVKLLACSLYDETVYAERSLHAGALGYVNKQEATRTIVAAIRQVMSGKVYLSERMSEVFAQRLSGGNGGGGRPAVAALSDRELEVYQLVGQGLKTPEIAAQLQVGIKTIETYRHRIKEKLNLKNTAQLARDAAHWVLDNG